MTYKNILGIIQARTNSSRLPGKVLLDIRGKPTLERVINRVKFSNLLDHLVVATTNNEIDNGIVNLCEDLGVDVYRGQENDVLGRFLGAASVFKGTTIVRITADCPMHDGAIIDAAIDLYEKSDYDYVSNVVKRSFPDGLDTEVFSYSLLETCNNVAKHKFFREHVTTYIRGVRDDLPSGGFSLGHLIHTKNYAHLRWTLDTEEDLKNICNYYKVLPENFSWLDAIEIS